VYLHAKIKHPGQANAEMKVVLLVQTKEDPDVEIKHSLLLSILDTKVQPSFNTAILGGLLYIIRELPLDCLLTVHCSSSFLGKALITNHMEHENSLLYRDYNLIRSIVFTMKRELEGSASRRWKITQQHNYLR
jgi:hypothetical protein